MRVECICAARGKSFALPASRLSGTAAVVGGSLHITKPTGPGVDYLEDDSERQSICGALCAVRETVYLVDPSGGAPMRTPILRDAPAGQQNFGFSGPIMAKSFETSRASRARNATKPGKNHEFGPRQRKK